MPEEENDRNPDDYKSPKDSEDDLSFLRHREFPKMVMSVEGKKIPSLNGMSI